MTEQQYNSEIEYIFNRFPSFQKVGGSAYKPGIDGMRALADATGNPHTKFKSIHIAGTNGKGSTSHMIASALGSAGNEVRVGLYTSPHLVDFRERIKIMGPDGYQMVPKEYVYTFIQTYKHLFEELGSSFFEITTALAFSWFASMEVDIAVIECGLGGRLDSTNIISPELSIITNIGLDHCDFLGSTIESIASEKAGIIKSGVPVIISEESGAGDVFRKAAAEKGAPIIFAEDYSPELFDAAIDLDKLDLKGACQERNIKGVAAALDILLKMGLEWNSGAVVDPMAVVVSMKQGIYNAAEHTGLHGRWEKLSEKPYVVCDTGHNSHGFKLLGEQISKSFREGKFKRLFMVFGVVADKDIDSIVEYLPNECINGYGERVKANYFFVNAKGTRALSAEKLKNKMNSEGFEGKIISDGNIFCTLQHCMENMSQVSDMLFIGGSTFVVAEAIPYFKKID